MEMSDLWCAHCISKIFQRCFYNQIQTSLRKHFHCGFRHFLSKREQRVKLGSACRSWKELWRSFCVTFHFLYRITIANKHFTNKRRVLFRSLLQCFDFNCIEINRGECHMLFSGNGIVSANIENNAITSEN